MEVFKLATRNVMDSKTAELRKTRAVTAVWSSQKQSHDTMISMQHGMYTVMK